MASWPSFSRWPERIVSNANSLCGTVLEDARQLRNHHLWTLAQVRTNTPDVCNYKPVALMLLRGVRATGARHGGVRVIGARHAIYQALLRDIEKY